jgi:DNA-binding XRE family transcriptional regulator/predicted RNase H-like HicB family nuclease
MVFSAKVFREGKLWVAEVSALDGITQGHTRTEAIRMLKGLVEDMVDKEGFSVRVVEVGGDDLLIETNDQAAVTAVMLKRQRMKRGLTVRDVAKALGSNSPNAYAAYENGKREPSISKVEELLTAIDPKRSIRLKVG